MYKFLTNGVNLAKSYIAKVVEEGSIVIDATAGNGKDTLFLAKLVGDKGKVIAFDIQKEALNNCLQLLTDNGYQNRVELIQDSHENLDKYISATSIDAVMFNLGYLPGGSPSLITDGRTTCKAISKALNCLKPGGMVSIVVYPGHAGGQNEGEMVEALVEELDQKLYSAVKIDFPNRINNSPYLMLIEKSGGI